jgi:flagellar biosynthesis/type III secretory pathway protein FliH
MAVIRRADAATLAREAIVLDLAEIGQQAERMLSRAREEAASIVAEARAERQRLIQTASKEGFDKGHAEGFAKGRQEGAVKGEGEARVEAAARIEALSAQWTDGLRAFESARDDMLVQARTDVLALALALGRKVVKRVVEVDRTVVAAQMEAAVARVTHASRLTIAVHPEDLEIAAAEAPRMLERIGKGAHASVTADAALSRGSCVVRTARGRIDAEIGLQLDRIVDALLPSAGSAPTDDAPAAPGAEPGAEPGAASGGQEPAS